MARIFTAMNTYPEMVAGEDRFCTALMRSFPGRLIGKVGRNAATLIPMMVGAVAGEELNRRATRRVGRQVATALAIPPPRR